MADGLGISFKISAIDDFSKTMSSLNSTTKKAFDSIGKVGAALTAAGAAGVIGLGATVKVAADFESAMSRVGALSGATDKQMGSLTQTAKDLGATTSFSASQAAEGMSYLAMAGYDTNEIIAAMPGLLNAAAAGQTDLGTTADITSNILSGFGLQASETARVADVLTKTFTSSNVDLQMLGETMKYVAPTANAMGLSLEEVAAAAGILGNAGIQGSQAGTSLSMSLTRLASPTKEASTLMQQLGFNAFDSQGKMLPLADVMTNLQTATSGLTEQQKLHAISTIFGAESMKSMLTLLEAGPETLQTFTGELQNAGGTAQTIAEQQLNNLNGQLTILKSGFEAMAISIGTALLPVLKWLAEQVQGLVDWFNGLNEGTKTTIAVVAALATGFALIAGPIMIMISLLPAVISGLGAIAGALGVTVSAMMTTIAIIGGVVTALALIGAALVVAYNKVDWFRNMVDSAWAGIKSAWNSAVNFVSDITKKVMSAVVAFGGEQLAKFQGLWDKHGSAILAFVKIAFEGIKLTISVAMAAIETIFRTVWPIIQGVVKIAWEYMKVIIGSAIDIVVGLIDAGMSLLQGDWKGAWNAIKGIAEDIWHNIEAFFSNIDLVEIGKDIIRGLVKGIGSMKDAVLEKVASIANAIPKGVKNILDIHSPSRVMKSLGEYVAEGLAVGIRNRTKDVEKASREMSQIVREESEKQFQHAKDWIDERKFYGQLSLVDEIKAWRQASTEYAMTAQQKQEADRKVFDLKKELNEKMKSINSDYYNQVKSVNDNLIAEENRLNEEYSKALDSRTKSLIGFAGLFDKVTQNAAVSGSELVSNLKGQVDSFRDWAQDITELAAKGIDEGLLSELREMGPKAAAEIDALNNMTKSQLDEYVALWQEKNALAKSQAESELSGMRKDTESQIEMLQHSAASKLESLRKEWVGKIAEIKNGTKAEFSDMDSIGRNAIKGLIDGMNAMNSDLVGKAKQIAETVKDAIKDALDIHSPSRVMKTIGEFIGEGLVDGMLSTVGNVARASNQIADASVPKKYENLSRSGGSFVGSMQPDRPQTVIVQSVLDGKVIAETVYPDINRQLYADQQIASRTGGSWRK